MALLSRRSKAPAPQAPQPRAGAFLLGRLGTGRLPRFVADFERELARFRQAEFRLPIPQFPIAGRALRACGVPFAAALLAPVPT